MAGLQDHFPQFFAGDRRVLHVNQLVRIRPEAETPFKGLWMLLKEIDADYVTGLVLVLNEDPRVVRLPRTSVESIRRALQADMARRR